MKPDLDIYSKPTCLEVFMVNNLGFSGGQNIYFSWWFHIFFYFHTYLGDMIQFDEYV